MIDGRINRLTVENFRSLKKISIPLDHLSVYLGANGTGKTNIYRSLELCHHAAIGDLSKWLAKQGGMNSAFWAGDNKSHDSNRIEVTADIGDYRYHLELGMKGAGETIAAFPGEPLIKEERIEFLSRGRKHLVMERKGPAIVINTPANKRVVLDTQLLPTQTALSSVPTDLEVPEIANLRAALLAWRFYHAFRVDQEAPVRQPCEAVTATKLNADGSNLAAVFATLDYIKEDTTDLKTIIAQAFDNAQLHIPAPSGTSTFSMIWPDLPKREFNPSELSDGTIQFLALSGALLSYHTPPLIILNEPETSLHPDMMPALASLISKANETAQIIVVTHSQRLANELENLTACPVREVIKTKGQTNLIGSNTIGLFKAED